MAGARAGFAEGTFARAAYQSRLAAHFAQQLPAAVGPGIREEVATFVSTCRALDAEARRLAPDELAAWAASRKADMDAAVAGQLRNFPDVTGAS